MSNLGNRYVELMLQSEAQVLKGIGLSAFNDGHDKAAAFLYAIANDLERQIQLMQMVEQTSRQLKQDPSTTAQRLERKQQMYMGEY